MIRVLALNLRDAAKKRLGGQDAVWLDVGEAFRLPLSKEVERLDAEAKMRREGALRTSIPQTQVNDSVLVEYLTPLTVDRRSDYIEVRVDLDGIPLPLTRMYVVERNDANGTWEVEFDLGEKHWSEAASNKRINTIDFGAFDLTYTNILTSWAKPAYEGDYTPQAGGANDAYYWPIVDYGDWVDRAEPEQSTEAPVKIVAIEDLRPHVSLLYLLKRGFHEIGWTLKGDILETNWFRRLWVYLLKPDYYEGVGADGFRYGKFCRIIGRTTNQDLEVTRTLPPNSPFIYFRSLDFAGSTTAPLPYNGQPDKWLLGIKNELPFRARFRFNINCYIETIGIPVLPRIVTFNVQEVIGAQNNAWSGEILSDDVAIELQPNSSHFFAADFEFELNPGQKAAINWASELGGDAFVVKKGLWFRCEPANRSLVRTDKVLAGPMFRQDITLLDVLKAALHLVNGRVHTDYVRREIEVSPDRSVRVYDEQVAGFFKEDAPAIDVNGDVVAGSARIRFKRNDLKRYTRFAFKQSNDAYIRSLPAQLPPHARRVANGDDLLDEEERIENPLFEPTIEGQSDKLKIQAYTFVSQGKTEYAPRPYLPRYWDNDEGERSFDIGPRILFAFGYVKQKNPRPLSQNLADTFATFFWDDATASTSTLGYASQLRTWPVDPAPALDGSVVFDGQRNNLFAIFYAGWQRDRQKGAFIEVLQRLRAQDYTGFDFRQAKRFVYEGRPVIAYTSAINDFQPPLPTPVVYEVPAQATSLCALPCSCVFRLCDYYQDLGPYIQQTTLDDLRIISFKVEGVEQIETAVPLGKINLVDLGGSPYITNLVDALNSIAAPFFMFYYSSRLHPTKGARFFRVKHPACWTFEIVIGNLDEPVYRYTHDKQEQRWFGSDWSPIGYGSDTFDAPDNCEEVTDYL